MISNKEEKEKEIGNLNLVIQESAPLEKELAEKSAQISDLECQIEHLETKVKDQNDDIDTKAEMIMDLKSSQRKTELTSSHSSLADEINFADYTLEKDDLKQRIETLEAELTE